MESTQKSEKSEDGTQAFVFIYECDGKFYDKLEKIEKKDKNRIIIHPVYYSGYDNTMTSESVVWNESDGKYVSESLDGSWLDTMKEYKDLVESIDNTEAVYHEGEYYHCDGCLLERLVGDLEKVPIQ